VLEAVFILLEFLSPSRRIFIGAHSLPPSLVRRIGPSKDRHKLSPPWEGPFIIHQVLRSETYKIQYEDGQVVSNTWDIKHLWSFCP
jgi:hypothetical protein